MDAKEARFEVAAPSPSIGDRIRFLAIYGEDRGATVREAIVTSRMSRHGDAILILHDGTWCYRHDVIEILPPKA